MLVDITASARSPGTRKSGGVGATGAKPKKISKTTGTTRVMSKLSPRRNVSVISTRS